MLIHFAGDGSLVGHFCHMVRVRLIVLHFLSTLQFELLDPMVEFTVIKRKTEKKKKKKNRRKK